MKKLLASVFLLAASTATVAATSPFFFPAGEIQVGTPATIYSPLSPQYTGVAHYYQNGTTGSVAFTCSLQGKGSNKQVVIAPVFPTKNFNIKNPIAILTGGKTIERTWYLSDENEANGNVNIRLDVDTTGEGAIVQCQGTYTA